jgi:hypothetical protein
MRAGPVVLGALALWLTAAVARAEPPTVVLAGVCDDRAALERALAEGLPAGETVREGTVISVTVGPGGSLGLEASIAIGGGEPRTLAGRDCGSILAAAGLVAALAVPLEPPEPPTESVVPAPRRAAPELPGAGMTLGLAGGVETLALPGATWLGAARLGLTWPSASLEVGGFVTGRSSADAGDGVGATFGLWGGRVDLCVGWASLRLCGLAEVGAVSATGHGVMSPEARSTVWTAGGLGVRGRWSLGRVTLLAQVEGVVPTARTRFALDVAPGDSRQVHRLGVTARAWLGAEIVLVR